MAKVRITTADQQPWQVSGKRVECDAAKVILEDGGPASAYKMRELGNKVDPQLVELRFHPHEEIELHYHDECEIMYILSGSIIMGSRTLGPGACIYIGGGVVYGFKAGPEGLHFLNFRGHVDTTFHKPDKRGIMNAAAVPAE